MKSSSILILFALFIMTMTVDLPQSYAGGWNVSLAQVSCVEDLTYEGTLTLEDIRYDQTGKIQWVLGRELLYVSPDGKCEYSSTPVLITAQDCGSIDVTYPRYNLCQN